MTLCPGCQKDLPSDATSCPACGSLLTDSFSPTRRIEPRGESHEKPRSSRAPSSLESIDNARFVPGTIFAERYRMVGLLGKGGMGEVYRADDLKLGQPVALKFLPDHLLSDGAALARFHREVRVARQVSHKNVCRVYDIGELDGHHFLSMEFIKGEELSSLLRRIGRLPAAKAIQIARQMCAGLAAAHENGVLHRDLKPSNVMIDGEGNARITDFGLAGLSEEFRDEEMSAGTPAYMSPEQIEGQAVTVRSDIYSLGLVLYELFTGKRAYEAPTLGELMRLRRSDTTPTTPSEIVEDIDPVVERLIARCMQKDPAKRPASALQVAAALPGGDPIAAALAAGETPSPEMVAAAPKEGALRPAIALAMFASVLILTAAVVFLTERVSVYGLVPLEKSSEVLSERARDIIQKAGYAGAVADDTHAFAFDMDALEYIARTDARPERWQDLKDGQPAMIIFWYRQSPHHLASFELFRDLWNSPPPIMSGMTGVKLDTRGRLLDFYAVPPQIDPVPAVQSPTSNVPSSTSNVQNRASSDRGSSPTVKEGSEASSSNVTQPDWSILFTEAGLRIADFTPVASEWAPRYVNDTRLAWTGIYPDQPQIPIRIEAASYRGTPVQFSIVNPFSKPERQDPIDFARQLRLLFILLISVFILVLIGSVLFAIRNLRLGRGDRKGALRLGIFVFALFLVSEVFAAHHTASFAEFGVLLTVLEAALFAAVFFWVLYIALEPFIRKRWPNRIISWSRLLAGDFRDPLVGRDVLIGALVGLGITTWQIGFYYIRNWSGDPRFKPAVEPASWLLGMENFVIAFTNQLSTPLLNAFVFLFLVLLLAMIVRRDWLGFLFGWLTFTAGLAFLGGNTLFSWTGGSVSAGLFTLVLYRHGLLALMVSLLFLHIYIMFPVTSHLTAWYATGFVLDLILMMALACYAFYTSLAGQPVFSGKLLQDD
jgi:hypothetical protein